MTSWGYLERIGGIEDATTVPQKIQLQDSDCFVGRFAEPVKAPDSKFTHKSQTLIPCLFVSSTHFSVGMTESPGHPRAYYIRDFSRNGTYLNGELVGPNKTAVFNDGAEISLLYKNKVRILYRFREEGVAVKDSAPIPSPVPVKDEARDDQEESSRFASMRSQADSVEFALNKQIALLQEESKQLETRNQQQASRIAALAADLHRAAEKNTSLDRVVATLEAEKSDLTERLSSSESNTAAVEARNQKLEEQVEASKSELRDLRAKNTQLAEDLQTKTAQLDARIALMENSNKTMTNEKSKWTKLENKYSAACEQLEQRQEQIDRMQLAAQALQDILSDRDASLALAKQRYEKLREVFERGQRAVQDREKSILELHQQLSNAAHVLVGLSREGMKLTTDSAYFEEIAAGIETNHDWSSQVSARAEDTYAEGSYHSQTQGPPTGFKSSPLSLPHSMHESSVSTPGERAPPTATGTVNGADSQSPVPRAAVSVGEKLDIDAESDSPASTSSQSLHRSEKRKRSAEGSQEGLAGGSPKKLHQEKNNMEEEVMQVNDNDGSDQEKDEEAEHDDMQATQAPANFKHLFEDSDGEEEDSTTAPQHQMFIQEAEDQAAEAVEGADEGAMEVEDVEDGADGKEQGDMDEAAAPVSAIPTAAVKVTAAKTMSVTCSSDGAESETSAAGSFDPLTVLSRGGSHPHSNHSQHAQHAQQSANGHGESSARSDENLRVNSNTSNGHNGHSSAGQESSKVSSQRQQEVVEIIDDDA
eukprot:CAMPEP_0184992846 /NCGR_PEP_ID=MMETSP1098-20130426/42850_1 /TAXON_ID=89044 /ORGANISM="Spumella elongata, Strain CCAP 955/1" /LENGTH=760 /DNA_ID=CAMNT_0027518557 /DNA_START=26 /DNA_END=2308 /DNA_ORIENTATION=+